MKSFLAVLAFASLGFVLRGLASRFERWVERADWVRIDRVLSAGCGVFLIAVTLLLTATVVNSLVTEAIAQAAR